MKQKVALITNIASTGIALSIGQRLGAAGAQLILTDPNEKKLRTIVADLKNVGIKASGVAVDLSKTDQRTTCFEKIKEKTDRLDVVVPCVLANTIRGDIIEASRMQLDECYHQNLTSPFRVCQSAIPLLRKSTDGSIVFVISFAGYTCFADIGLYSATQTATLGMVKAMAQSLAKEKIRVNSVVHGMLSDDGANGMWNQNDQNINNGLANLIPIGRVGKGSDCAPLVEFLASAKYITGENTSHLMNRASTLFTGRLRLPPPIHPSEFANRRHKLIEILKSKCKSPVVLVRGNLTAYSAPDVPYNFRQCSHFRYLTNCNEPGSFLVQTEDRSTLFVYKKTDDEIVWEGPPKSMEKIKTDGAFDEILPSTELPAFLASQLKNGRTLAGDKRPYNQVIVQELIDQFSGPRIDLLDAIDYLRWIKSNAEIDHMRCAAMIGSEALNAVMQQAHGIADESTIVGLLEYEMRRRGADCMSYPPVVCGADRCNTIHYLDANKSFNQDDCVLIDAGAFFRGYCSDITRCFPISGRFSPAQRELYEALYSIQEECLDFARNTRPLKLNDIFFHMIGTMAETLASMSFFSGEMNADELIKETEKLCPHHVSHYLGCDVHDSATVLRTIPLKNSVAITVEPGRCSMAFITSFEFLGIYVTKNNKRVKPEFRGIGFRIEDDVLITENGIEVLSASCVKNRKDIEAVMSQ